MNSSDHDALMAHKESECSLGKNRIRESLSLLQRCDSSQGQSVIVDQLSSSKMIHRLELEGLHLTVAIQSPVHDD